FDMRGKQLLEQPLQTASNTVQLNLTNYSAGTYLAVLVLDGYNAARVKVVKQ
ncbi:MAG: T9SS type A sorting domain-containing protein, partial [Bacteroidia bacterium]|nr:T9SS type A sorting domain-containing protein [Bacteroidia bacterium]